MTFNFFPSLQIIAYSRIARGILYTFDLEVLKNYFIYGDLVRTCYIQRIREKVCNIVLPTFKALYHSDAPTESKEKKYLVLPNVIEKKMIGVVMALGLEITKWFEMHQFILDGNNLDLKNRLIWFSFGIIDRFNTARNYIRDENFSFIDRFILACRYYFEDDVQMLWASMTRENRFNLAGHYTRTRSMRLWLEIVNTNNSLDWEEISLNEKEDFFVANTLGMRYYFTRLRGHEMRQLCIYNALLRRSHTFDLYSCLSRINEDELNVILADLPKATLYEFFESFLDWPFQIIFLNVVNNFQHIIDGHIFSHLITVSLNSKIRTGWQDYPYEDLFVSIWNLMSDKYGSYVDDDEETICIYLRDYLESSGV